MLEIDYRLSYIRICIRASHVGFHCLGDGLTGGGARAGPESDAEQGTMTIEGSP